MDAISIKWLVDSGAKEISIIGNKSELNTCNSILIKSEIALVFYRVTRLYLIIGILFL